MSIYCGVISLTNKILILVAVRLKSSRLEKKALKDGLENAQKNREVAATEVVEKKVHN